MNDISMSATPRWRYRVVHETSYRYQSSVTLSHQLLHLTPRQTAFQTTEAHQITVDVPLDEFADNLDYFGNPTRRFVTTQAHRKLLVRAESTLVLGTRPQLGQLKATPPWESLRDSLQLVQQSRSPILHEACRYLYESPHVRWNSALERFASASFLPRRPLLEAAFDLTRRIFTEFEFDNSATTISTPLEKVFEVRKGVCQDFAQLMIGCLRSLGLPARYVSGYLLTHPPAGQARMIGADASHAWVSVYCPVLGWTDFDPTNGCLVQKEHMSLGWGRDFSDVTPMRGVVLGGGEQQLQVSVTVTPLTGSPVASVA